MGIHLNRERELCRKSPWNIPVRFTCLCDELFLHGSFLGISASGLVDVRARLPLLFFLLLTQGLSFDSRGEIQYFLSVLTLSSARSFVYVSNGRLLAFEYDNVYEMKRVSQAPGKKMLLSLWNFQPASELIKLSSNNLFRLVQHGGCESFTSNVA